MGYKEGVNREGPHGTKIESSRFSGFDPKEWEGGRYGEILNMVCSGATNEEIMARHAGVDNLCEMYRKIVNGTTANFGSINDPYVLRGKGKIAERRQRMLMLAATEMSDKEIAVETGYTVNTVRQALYGNRRVHDKKEERDYGI